MGRFLTILKIEMKRALKSLPYFLAGAVVLAVLAGTIAFSANRMLYGEQSVGSIQVGVAGRKMDHVYGVLSGKRVQPL